MLRGPDRTRVLVQLAPGVILGVVFTLRHGIHDRVPKPNEHNPLGNVCPIGIVEPRDHVERLKDAGEAVETALDGKQHVNLVLVQQATIKIEIEKL